jgi:transcriptional regulator with XRE-family HTH domain
MQAKTLEDLGRAIRAARRQSGLTQEAAAALCGVSMPFLNQLEGAKRMHLSTSKVLGVMAALGIRLELSGPGIPMDPQSDGTR